MKAMLQIYGTAREEVFQKELKRLSKARISQRNKELITNFQNYLLSSGSGDLRVAKLGAQLRRISQWLPELIDVNKNLDELGTLDVQKLVAFINTQLPARSGLASEATKCDYRRVIKQFYHWIGKDDDRLYDPDMAIRMKARRFYDSIKEVSLSYKQQEADPTTIISEEEIKQVVEVGCRTPKEKAFLMFLHESGCRAAEFLNLRIGDIIFKESYGEIHVPDGKTGRRTIFVVNSIPYLQRYLDIHPFKKNQGTYLWIGENRANMYKPLLHKGGQKLIDRCFDRTDVGKKHNWHWFRHSRATILAPQMMEAMLCKYMGWKLGSRQVKNYVHLCVKQLEDVYLATKGIRSKDEQVEQPVKCLCGNLNPSNLLYCFKCCKPLRVETIIKQKQIMDAEGNKTVKLLMDIMQNPELLRKFQEFKKSLNEKK